MKKGCLRAKSRAFSAVIPKGGFAPLRYVPAGTVATPLFGDIRRVACTLLRKDAWLCRRQFFFGLFFYFFAFFDSML